MNTAAWMRQGHRWLSIVFSLAVAGNFAFRAVASGEPPAWLTYSPLPPLLLQWLSGLYLFARPHLERRRAPARA